MSAEDNEVADWIDLTNIPGESWNKQILTLVRDQGLSPEEAVATFFEPYGRAPIVRAAYSVVLREARKVSTQIRAQKFREARLNLLLEKGSKGFAHDEVTERILTARDRLRRSACALPDGDQVVWDDLTLDQIEAKIAWMRAHVGSLMEHMNILDRVRQLMVRRRVTRLGDIPNWPDQVAVVQVAQAMEPTAIGA